MRATRKLGVSSKLELPLQFRGRATQRIALPENILGANIGDVHARTGVLPARFLSVIISPREE